jgi:hypothetical protein
MNLTYPWGKPPEGKAVVWRVEAKRYSYVINADCEEYGITSPVLEAVWAEPDRYTPKGFWVFGQFTLAKAKRRKWSNTVDEALEHFRQRRIKQIKILKGQLAYAEFELALLNPTPPTYIFQGGAA